jgi:ribonuclease R
MTDRLTPPPTREQVLAYLDQNPGQGSKRDIARGLDVASEHRAELRRILQELEAEGALVRTAKRAYGAVEQPPPTGVVRFERIDADGDLIGRSIGRDGAFGPDLVYAGASGRARMPAPGVGDKALCSIAKGADSIWRARMIKPIDAAPETSLVGVFRANRHGGIVEPASRKEKTDYIIEKADARNAADGDLVRFLYKSGRGDGPRRGSIIEVIGRADDPLAASLIALHTHGVPDEFPEAVVAEAREVRPAKVTREDLTRIPLITIDPEDARDHDDAVFAEPSGKGWRVIVAIADVAAFVRRDTRLDREAYRRGNSTYFPDRVAPMLPEHLSADLCSLREGELRETLAVEMIFGADGRKVSHRFIRGRMRSAAKLSYREAQDAIDGKPNDRTRPLLEPVLQPLWAAWRCADLGRQARDPLELDLPERRVRIGQDGKITSITFRDRFDAHKLIEEFMIQANVCAAETLEKARITPVYRIHDEPSEEKIAALATFLSTVGLKFAKGEKVTGARFNRLLGQARESENEQLIHELVLRSQAQARYAPGNVGHFGLNLPRYAHFTSPIRRYADLVVHRALIRALDLGPEGATDEELSRLEETAEHITMTERRSMAAERDALDRYMAIYMTEHVGAHFAGRIAGVTRAGLFIRLSDTGADGFSPAARLGEEYWVYDEQHGALVGQRTGRRYELGMEVEVKLLEATPLTGGLLFGMLTAPKARRRDLKPPDADRRMGPNPRRRGPPPGARSSKGGRKRR